MLKLRGYIMSFSFFKTKYYGPKVARIQKDSKINETKILKEEEVEFFTKIGVSSTLLSKINSLSSRDVAATKIIQAFQCRDWNNLKSSLTRYKDDDYAKYFAVIIKALRTFYNTHKSLILTKEWNNLVSLQSLENLDDFDRDIKDLKNEFNSQFELLGKINSLAMKSTTESDAELQLGKDLTKFSCEKDIAKGTKTALEFILEEIKNPEFKSIDASLKKASEPVEEAVEKTFSLLGIEKDHPLDSMSKLLTTTIEDLRVSIRIAERSMSDIAFQKTAKESNRLDIMMNVDQFLINPSRIKEMYVSACKFLKSNNESNHFTKLSNFRLS